MRVLIVDDDVVQRKILKSYLKFTGKHQIIPAATPESALEQFCKADATFDLVIMDNSLGADKTGSDLIVEFREWEKENNKPRTPILFNTSDFDGGNPAQGLARRLQAVELISGDLPAFELLFHSETQVPIGKLRETKQMQAVVAHYTGAATGFTCCVQSGVGYGLGVEQGQEKTLDSPVAENSKMGRRDTTASVAAVGVELREGRRGSTSSQTPLIREKSADDCCLLAWFKGWCCQKTIRPETVYLARRRGSSQIVPEAMFQEHAQTPEG